MYVILFLKCNMCAYMNFNPNFEKYCSRQALYLAMYEGILETL